MRYNKIRKMDISNGPGIRTSIFMQGCTFHCKNCFNPETYDFDKGEELTDEVIDKLLKLSEPEYIKGLSILGGEPLHPRNALGTLDLVKKFKEKYPNKTVWVWTGFLYEKVNKLYDLSNIDVLIDGQFKEELHDPTLKYRGSSNQRVIDIKKTKEKNKLVTLV